MGVLILVALAALLCGVFLQAQGFVLFGGVLAVIALGTVWPWLSLRGLRGSIAFDKGRAAEGERVEVRLTLCNRLPWAAYGLKVRGGLRDQTTHGDADGPWVGVPVFPGGRTAGVRWAFTPVRRGVYPPVPPTLTTAFPFGIWESRRALAVEAPLLVWPRTYPVGPAPTVSGDRRVEGAVSNKMGSNGDVLGVRPYRRGDSPRRIHWGQSARHDRLIVCELQANARPVVQLVLDADPRVHCGRGPDGSREWAIRIVASLARGWLAAGLEVGAAWNGQAIPAAAGPKQLNALLDGLAMLPDATGASLAETMRDPTCRNFIDGLQVIVSTDIGVGRTEPGGLAGEHQRWVVLQGQGFLGADAPGSPVPPARLPIRPWLWIDGPDYVATLLRGGWKEARHGS